VAENGAAVSGPRFDTAECNGSAEERIEYALEQIEGAKALLGAAAVNLRLAAEIAAPELLQPHEDIERRRSPVRGVGGCGRRLPRLVSEPRGPACWPVGLLSGWISITVSCHRAFEFGGLVMKTLVLMAAGALLISCGVSSKQSCNNTCTAAGVAQCSGTQIQTCTADTNGCLAWSVPTACPSNLTCNATQNKCIDHLVSFAWAPNRESGVNRAGGGYRVSISGQPTINVPFVSGPTAPTSATARLPPGTYTVVVRAYAAIDAQGGSTGSLSAPSQSVTVNVP